MRVKPVIFSTPMVRAERAGNKDHTRRIITKAIPDLVELLRDDTGNGPDSVFIHDAKCGSFCDFACGGEILKAPYQPGDVLWVREAWAHKNDITHAPDDQGIAVYRADDWDGMFDGIRWRPSIHMPKWACRTFLKVESVRAQRVQDITEADAIAEGIRKVTKDDKVFKYCVYDLCKDMSRTHWQDMPRTAKEAFAALWDSIHGPGAWARNDWVWAYTFTRTIKPEGFGQ